MASNAEPTLIEQFAAITGADSKVAKTMLEACNGNLEMAIGMHMDGGPVTSHNEPNHPSGAAHVEDDVRAPIPQKHETLVEEQRVYGFRRNKRKTTSSVFDGFRDFQAEIDQQQNEQAASTSRATKCRRLEDLFRPPIDLLFKGSFHSARDSGVQQNKWLMVNVQNVQEFACQVLNRDVWSHPAVRDIVAKSFLLWQVYHDSEEGQKFSQFYPVQKAPYIAIIDPRTGEKMSDYYSMDALTFCDLVGDFVIRHPTPSGITTPSPPPSKRQKTRDSIIDSSEDSQLQAALDASVQQTRVNAVKARALVLDSDSEDDDLPSDDEELETFSGSDDDNDEPVTKSPVKCSQSPKLEKQVASLQRSQVVTAKNTDKEMTNGIAKAAPGPSTKDTDILEKVVKLPKISEPAPQKDKWREYLGEDNDATSTLLIKFPDGEREQIKMPCSSQLRALTEYLHEKGYHRDQFDLLTHYPRRNLSSLEPQSSLKDAGLFPQETVFVHEK